MLKENFKKTQTGPKGIKKTRETKNSKEKKAKKYMYLTDYSENVQAAMKLYV